MRAFVAKFARMDRVLASVAQLGIFALSGTAAFLLRFDFSLPPAYLIHLTYALPIWILVKAVIFRIANLDRAWWQYVSIADLQRVAVGNLAGSALSCITILAIAPSGFPRSIYAIDLMICFLGTAGVRMIVRMMAEAAANGCSAAKVKNTLIYGAGNAGILLLREIRRNDKLPYRVLGFLDDRPDKKGLRILGTSVLGGGSQLKALAQKRKIDIVLITIPSASGTDMTRILELCHAAGVECKTIPSLGELIESNGLATQIRDIAVEDLLGRTPVRLDHDQISAKLTGSTVLVTGAAGSIGSELCRQVARFNPRAIVGLEVAETALFYLDREMRKSFPDVPFYPEIGNIQNVRRLTEIMERHRPSILYHAAAYKHVPMMEAHVFEAVENNVFGTWNVAASAAQHGVRDFVLISSDKAVRPTNVMGATKRVAEFLSLEFQNTDMRAVSVRFGNVLGSNGSVIPIFREQIAAGGPVTVTHPEMRRYFMTIPEASQLVLQSSTMGRGGEIFVLDMGEPVKIVDLARNLILLSGLRPNEDIKIEFSGTRPGEKLYEELNSMDEDTLPTTCEKIKIFTGNGLPAAGMQPYLEVLRDICASRDLPSLVLTLKDLIPDYNPGANLLRRAVLVSKPVSSVTSRTHVAVAG